MLHFKGMLAHRVRAFGQKLDMMKEKVLGFTPGTTRRQIESDFEKRWHVQQVLEEKTRDQYYWTWCSHAIFPDPEYMKSTLPSYEYYAGSARYISDYFQDRIGESLMEKASLYRRYKENASSINSSGVLGKFFALLKNPDPDAREFFRDSLGISEYPVLISRFTDKTAPDFEWPDLDPLAFIKSDKLVYRPSEESARLAIAIPGRANLKGEMLILKDSLDWFRGEIQLNEAGIAQFITPKLDKGNYKAIFKFLDGCSEIDSPLKIGSQATWWTERMRQEYEDNLEEGKFQEKIRCGGTEYSVCCEFEAAIYVLPEFEASLVSATKSLRKTEFSILVKSLGVRYEGVLTIELTENGRTVDSSTSTSINGIVAGQFTLRGNGPFSISVISDQGTASVFLPGSSAASRREITTDDGCELTTFPEKETSSARGVYVKEGTSSENIFQISSHIARECVLKTTGKARLFAAVAVDQNGKTVSEFFRKNVQPGEEWRFKTPANYAFIFWAISDGNDLTEGWTAIIKPTDLELSIQTSPKVCPQEKVKIKISTNAPGQTIPVLVTVRDKRLNVGSSPMELLARQLKEDYLDSQVRLFLEANPSVDMENLFIWNTILYEFYDRYEMKCGNSDCEHRRWIDIEEYFRYKGLCPKCSQGIIRHEREIDNHPHMLFLAEFHVQRRANLDVPNVPIQVNNLPPGAASQAPVQKEIRSLSTYLRKVFSDSLYCEIVSIQGAKEIEVSVGGSIGNYVVEAFALSPGKMDWAMSTSEFEVTQNVFGILQLPKLLLRDDEAVGSLFVKTPSSSSKIEVTRDGNPLAIIKTKSKEEYLLEVKPGLYRSYVEDLKSGMSDAMEFRVQEVGKFSHRVNEISILEPGKEISVGNGVFKIEIVPSIDKITIQTGIATKDYQHLCCEQTAAKILAAILVWKLAEDVIEKEEIEQNILAGLNRLLSMCLTGGGFSMYPGGSENTHYGSKAAFYLLHIKNFSGNFHDPQIKTSLKKLIEFAQNSARHYGQFPVKVPFENCHLAFLATDDPTTKQQAVEFARNKLQHIDSFFQVSGKDKVDSRSETAYAAAILAKDDPCCKQVSSALCWLGKAFNEEGRLYSTLDSTALLIFLNTLDQCGFGKQGHLIAENDELIADDFCMNFSQALSLQKNKQFNKIKSLKKNILLKILQDKHEEWGNSNFQSPPKIRIEPSQLEYKLGDTIKILIDLPTYQPGFIAAFYLPPVLAKLKGGVQIQSFTLDFMEKTQIETEVKVIGKTPKPQHLVIIIRNMFKEEDFWCSEKIPIKVK